MSSSRPIPLTEARPLLFRLADELLRGVRERVLLSHRGADDLLALMPASHLARLEQELDTLRKFVQPEPRPLKGMGTANIAVEDIVSSIRSRERELTTEKFEYSVRKPARRVAEGKRR